MTIKTNHQINDIEWFLGFYQTVVKSKKDAQLVYVGSYSPLIPANFWSLKR